MSIGAAARRQRFVYATHVKRVRELHGYRQLKGSRTLQKSDCRPTDEAEYKTKTVDDRPGL